MESAATATQEMSRVLDSSPVTTRVDLGRGAAILQRWRHGELHDVTQQMADHVVMTYLAAPRAIRRQDGRRLARGWARPGTVTVIPAGSSARWDIDGSLDAVHVYIPPDKLKLVCEEAGRPFNQVIERTASIDQRGSRLLRAMLAEQADADAKPDRLFMSEAADLLCLHLASAGHADGNSAQRRSGGLAPWQVRRICAYIVDRLADDISLSDLADVAGLSTYHLCREFKTSVGLPPHQWRLMQRVRRACDLLERTTAPVSEVAARVGYDDPGQLARLFATVMGTTPTGYRRDRENLGT